MLFLKNTKRFFAWLAFPGQLQAVVKVVVGILLLFTCAQASILIRPVPITFYTVGLLVVALVYPKNLVSTVVTLYVVLGALGLPMFSGFRGGISFLLGPAGGYLLGSIAAAHVLLYFRGKFGESSWLTLAVYGLTGIALVFFFV